jgi:precorrin-2 dehydrogenase / sirohydrochlorin ferrochelatase
MRPEVAVLTASTLQATNLMNVYPIFLNDLSQRYCVVVGGDHEAERKVEDLIACEAVVTVISPALSELLRRRSEEGRITWVPREFREGDLQEAFLVIVSPAASGQNQAIWREAQAERVLMNAMDDVPYCSFVAGSVVRRGDLVVSISTSGSAPVLAVRLREQLEQTLGPELQIFLEWMGDLREPMAKKYPDMEVRRHLWYQLVDADIIDLIRAGHFTDARARVEEITCLSSSPGPPDAALALACEEDRT